jgi:hypothetical protein
MSLILFSHKGRGGLDVFGRLIKWWTKGLYQHSELRFSDGMSFSSRNNGVGFKKIHYSHPERWDFIDLNVSKRDEDAIRQHALLHCGERYDWTGIYLDQFLGTKIHTEDKWWCSEIIAHVLNIYPEMTDPTELHKAVGEQYRVKL